MHNKNRTPYARTWRGATTQAWPLGRAWQARSSSSHRHTAVAHTTTRSSSSQAHHIAMDAKAFSGEGRGGSDEREREQSTYRQSRHGAQPWRPRRHTPGARRLQARPCQATATPQCATPPRRGSRRRHNSRNARERRGRRGSRNPDAREGWRRADEAARVKSARTTMIAVDR
jgi:hypothetical protein